MLNRFIVLVLMFCMSTAFAATPLQWQPLAPGLEYTQVKTAPYSKVHAFKIDPTLYRFELVSAKNLSLPAGANISEFAQGNNQVVAVNGGFFTPDRQPLGLRIENGVIQNPLKPISWWGIFYIKNNTPYIVGPKDFSSQNNINFAVQAGPRLVINGRIPPLKETLDERSALCIDQNQQIILISTQQAAFTLSDFAKILQTPAQEGGFGCYNALNLDGGHSSQLYAKMDSFELFVPNLSRIADAILVVPQGAGNDSAQDD